ncbi:DEAD/DEAH box helicase [Ligilactobacillus sp. 110_WCHN]|uniref:DEAD/DEAH box helicase n=1 Tax=Ligilactobacillus sp. 110_WCHN TaxID=3057125 RepID=UPI002671C67C|nr:DEAD/DEAH box helicase [Ligilactobacillus sp. 110_WCHN]MDO3392418.1 DEAD/DEAH box helicase [Ligilactobacillus sp. 110_WCHN]
MRNQPEIIKNQNGNFQLVDDENQTLQSSVAQRKLKIFNPYFKDQEQMIFNDEVTYVQIEKLINSLNKRLDKKGFPTVKLSQKYQEFIKQSKYYIKEQSDAGLTIKDADHRWDKELADFCKVVSQEVSRSLKKEQERASFFLTKMKRAANFSVPGAGKTAMMYGAFAYLSSPKINEVDRLLVVCPLNAFEAWRKEFVAVFGEKRQLNFMDLKDDRYKNQNNIKLDWPKKNVIVINFESLSSKLEVINELIDDKTMIVFDEVHRIKGTTSKRAKAALSLNKAPRYRYVLTGTPIPNGYKDIYNFLHIMYPDEYSKFFGWDVNELDNADPDEVNQKLGPFFWRTTKKDLNVPPAEADHLIEVDPSGPQLGLAERIHEVEQSALARYIRLIQASTNPSLLRKNINYSDLGLIEGESKEWDSNKAKIEKESQSESNQYVDLPLEQIQAPKFIKGIELTKQLVSQRKKVLIWAMFVDTMHKIQDALSDEGIKSTLVYGATPKSDREGMIDEFRNGDVQVLISNPNTLGESISLHQTVHDAIYFEYNFNLTFMLQSRDRIHRLGLPDDQYTRYYYLMTNGTAAESGFVDHAIYERLKEKEQVMLDAIEGDLLVPEYTDDYLEEVKRIIDGK